MIKAAEMVRLGGVFGVRYPFLLIGISKWERILGVKVYDGIRIMTSPPHTQPRAGWTVRGIPGAMVGSARLNTVLSQ